MRQINASYLLSFPGLGDSWTFYSIIHWANSSTFTQHLYLQQNIYKYHIVKHARTFPAIYGNEI